MHCAQPHVGTWRGPLPIQAVELQHCHLLAKPARSRCHQPSMAKAASREGEKQSHRCCIERRQSTDVLQKHEPPPHKLEEKSYCFALLLSWLSSVSPRHIQTKSLLLINSALPSPLQGWVDVGTGECVCVCFDFCPEPPQILRARFQLDTPFGGRQPVIKAFILWEGKLMLSVSPGGGGGRGELQRGTTVLFAVQFGALCSILGLCHSRFFLDVSSLLSLQSRLSGC